VTNSSSGLFAVVKEGILGFLKYVVTAPVDLLNKVLSWLVNLMVSTPYPDPAGGRIFGAPPESSSFYNLYNIYIEAILPLSTMLILFAFGLFVFTGIWAAKKERITAMRRLMFAIPSVLVWWYIAGWYLQFVDAITSTILSIGGGPTSAIGGIVINDLSSLGSGILIAVLLYFVGSLPAVVAVSIYLIRWVLIHLYMPGMPLLIAVWCIPIDPFNQWAESLMTKFVSISIIPIPVAFLLTMFGSINMESIAIPGASVVFESIVGIVILAIAAYLPKTMLGMSGSIGSAARTAVRGGRFAATGAVTGSTPGGKSGSTGSRGSSSGSLNESQSTLGDRGGGSPDAGQSDGDTGLQESTHGDTFSHPRASKARRQRERAAKLGVAARKGGSKLKGAASKTIGKGASATETAAGTTYANYSDDGSTVKGVASDAKEGAKKRAKRAGKRAASAAKKPGNSVSQRAQNIRDNVAQRQEQFKEEWGRGGGSHMASISPRAGFDDEARPFSDDTLSGGLAYTESSSEPVGEMTNSESTNGEDDDLALIDTQETGSVATNETFDRNSSDRELGGFGG
jgi:hypothetical protein